MGYGQAEEVMFSLPLVCLSVSNISQIVWDESISF